MEPFAATYAIVFKGVSAGTSELQLERQADGHYLYTSRSTARGMFRMFFSEDITQSSLLDLTDSGPRPLRYRADDGTGKTDKDISLDFDWTANRITGTAENRPVDIALTPGVQDTMSIQLALIHELRAGDAVIAADGIAEDHRQTTDGVLGQESCALHRRVQEGVDVRHVRVQLAAVDLAFLDEHRAIEQLVGELRVPVHDVIVRVLEAEDRPSRDEARVRGVVQVVRLDRARIVGGEEVLASGHGAEREGKRPQRHQAGRTTGNSEVRHDEVSGSRVRM
jgi:hypothetical protein